LSLPDAVAAVEVYAAFGGVPRYWDLMREGRYATAEEALDRLVFSPQGVLHEEAERVLRDEEAAAMERAVCELIGRGARRPSELAARLGVKDTSLAKPLRHLTELGLIERQAPYDFESGRPVSGGRRAFYKLQDPFLALWYACVRPYLSGLNLSAATARRHAREAWGHHVAAVWEDLCRQQWHRLGHAAVEWEPAGRYWVSREFTGAEWDVVSVSSDGKHVFLGECKWMRDATRAKLDAVIRTIKRRATPLLPHHPKVQWGLFIPDKGRLPPEIEGVTIFDAERVLTS
jgi:AAA+ ATPase superfamily predicted ATPase